MTKLIKSLSSGIALVFILATNSFGTARDYYVCPDCGVAPCNTGSGCTTTISAMEAQLDVNLLVSQWTPTVHILDGIDETAYVSFYGATEDATYYLTYQGYEGDKTDENTDSWSTDRFTWVRANGSAFFCGEDFMHVKNFQVKVTNNTANLYQAMLFGSYANGGIRVIDSNLVIIDYLTGATGSFNGIDISTTTYTGITQRVSNNIVWITNSTGDVVNVNTFIGIAQNGSGTGTTNNFYNNTIYVDSDLNFSGSTYAPKGINSSNANMTNNIYNNAIDMGDPDWDNYCLQVSGATNNADNNACSGNDGVSDFTGVTFTYTSPSTGNFNLSASDTTLINNATDLSGTFTNDFGVATRDTWNMGAYYYGGGGAPPGGGGGGSGNLRFMHDPLDFFYFERR